MNPWPWKTPKSTDDNMKWLAEQWRANGRSCSVMFTVFMFMGLLMFCVGGWYFDDSSEKFPFFAVGAAGMAMGSLFWCMGGVCSVACASDKRLSQLEKELQSLKESNKARS